MNHVIEPAYLSLSDWTGMTKTQITEQAKTVVETLLEVGGADKLAERLSAMEAFIKEVKGDERFVDYVREELARNGGKITTPSGAKIELMEAGTRYSFDKCGDVVLEGLEKELATLTAKVKARKDFLQKVQPSGEVVVDEESGEAFKVYPPAKSSTSTYKITLNK